MPSPVKRFYGWKRGLPTRRFKPVALPSYPPLPPSRSLIPTGYLPPIWDQGQTSSCTGHGTTRAIMYARAKQRLPFVDLSRLFPYWNARVMEGDTNDDGAIVEDVILASQQKGDCPYADLPTDPSVVTTPPSQQAFKDALLHKALLATRIGGRGSAAAFEYYFKYAIEVWQVPVVFGFTVYESFQSDQVATTGVVPMPGPSEQIVGGHCVAAVAYDDRSQFVTCDNSWSSSWGQAGRFQMPYAYIFDPDMASDFHVIVLES